MVPVAKKQNHFFFNIAGFLATSFKWIGKRYIILQFWIEYKVDGKPLFWHYSKEHSIQ